MSFNDRKSLAGQNYATVVTIELDRCRHTTDQSVIDGTCAASSISESHLGLINVSGGTPTNFIDSNPYILWDDEIIKIDILTDLTVDITARAQFGTTAAFHEGAMQIIHSGEADGTCQALPNTCSSPDTYSEDEKLYFPFPSTQLDVSERFYGGFNSWAHSSCTLDPGQTMGKRAGGTVTLLDGADLDDYVPYPARRSSKGTLFTKLLARNPNFEGRTVTVKTGFNPIDFDDANFITREYIIDSVDLNKGMFTVNLLDPLILTTDSASKCPVASDGTLSLLIDESSTEMTYANDVALAYGEVGETTLVRIGSEIITGVVLSDYVITITERATGGTEQSNHSVNDSVQLCFTATKENVVDLIERLITDYTPMDTKYLDDYTDIKLATSTINLTAIISKPTAVNTLINELIKNGDLSLYYNETDRKVKIDLSSNSTGGLISINEGDHIKQDSAKITRSVSEQYTRYSTAWSPNDVTKTKDEEYFNIVFQAINLNKELPEAKGTPNEKDIFYNRWLTNDNDDVIIGTSIAQRLLDRSSEVPEDAEFKLDVSSVFDTQDDIMDIGKIFSLSTSRSVNLDGSNKAVNHQLLSMKDNGNMQYTLKSRLFQDPLEGFTADFIISESKENYDLSTEYAPEAGNYVIFIETGVTIGSTSVLNPAFTTGTQAAGVTFEFLIRGSILGKGGDGGAGGIIEVDYEDVDEIAYGEDGISGGNAFEATVPCTINTGSGVIWGGGGGGAGRYSRVRIVDDITIEISIGGNGGCGAQGYGIASGGIKGYLLIDEGDFFYGIDGVDGNKQVEGILGEDKGGAFGEAGDDDVFNDGGKGGASGYGIITNGNTVTVTNGNNNLNIKGGIL